MSNIAIFVKNYSVDDTQPWLTDDLVTELHRRGNHVTVFFFDMKGSCIKGYYKRSKGFDIYAYPLKNVSKTQGAKKLFFLATGFLGMYLYFTPKLFKNRFDRLISFSMFSIFFGLNKVIKLKNKHCRSSAILWDFYPVHLIEVGKINNRLIGNILYKLENYELKCFDEICCMTKKSIEFFDSYHANLKHKQKKTIYLWRKLSESQPKLVNSNLLHFDPEKTYIIFGGQLSKGRGLEFLLDITLEHKNELSNIIFLIIGEGELKPLLESRIKQEKLNNVILLSHVSRPEYLYILSKTQIGLVITQANTSIPSFPSKSIDYMLMRRPILASVESTTDYGEIIERQIKCGLSSNQNNKKSFLSALLTLSKDSTLRNNMGERGHEFLYKTMTVEHVVNIILDKE